MVIVYGGVLVAESQVEAVTAAAREFQAACRAEPGCVDYRLSWDVAEPNRIRLLEAWTSEEASEAHKERRHVREWTRFIGEAAVEAPSFTRHVVPS